MAMLAHSRWVMIALSAALIPTAAGVAQPTPAQPAPSQPAPAEQAQQPEEQGRDAAPFPRGGTFEGFDFGQIVETMESSVSPLQMEMDRSFKLFTDRIREAERLLDAGRTDEAVQLASSAIDGVLQVREQVLEPMWAGQWTLTEQIGEVRARLARAVSANDAEADGSEINAESEALLNNIAGRIAAETDSVRTQRLTAHYRTVRNLARIKAMAQHLTPNQRKLWMNVLKVLDEAAVAHQQVLMGSEVLFAQLESTSINLRDYISLMETVQGASELLSVVRGAGASANKGLSGFAVSMNELQDRLGAFNESVQQALEGQMIQLSEQIDELQPLPDAAGPRPDNPTMPTGIDAELQRRIERLAQRRSNAG